jgi:hypothetical protein
MTSETRNPLASGFRNLCEGEGVKVGLWREEEDTAGWSSCSSGASSTSLWFRLWLGKVDSEELLLSVTSAPLLWAWSEILRSLAS